MMNNSRNNKKRSNRGRSSLRSASNREPNTSSTPDIKPQSSSETYSVSKSAQNKSKRPRKYATNTTSQSGSTTRGSSYNALLQAFSKRTQKPKAASRNLEITSDDEGNEDIDISDDDEEVGNKYIDEDDIRHEGNAVEFSKFDDYETPIIPDDDIGEEQEDIEDAVSVSQVEKQDAIDEQGSDLDDEELPNYDYDSDDERHQIEGFIPGSPNKPLDEEESQEEEEEEEEDKKTAEDQSSDSYFIHFQNVDSSVYESLPPPPTVTAISKPSLNLSSFSTPVSSASDSLDWESEKYTGLSSLPNRSIVYTLSHPHDALYKSLTPKTNLSSSMSIFDSFSIRPKLQDTWIGENPKLTALQRDLAGPILDYQDLLFPAMDVENHAELRRLYCLHVLNHVYKAQRTVYNNDIQLRLPQADSELEFHDQGFTKPKVLIVLPTKNACYQVLTQLAVMSDLQEINNKKRFKNAFYDRDMPPSSRPDDFIELFAGNSDDMFCLGIKITMKSMKFYANFYDADILVASPLGLDMILGKEGGEKKPEYDFLSSIEIAIVDQADAMIMQNWDHVEHIFNKLNVTPKDAHGCDFSRLKPWFTEEKAAYFRQSIILSQYLTPDMNSLFLNKCFNLAGKIKVRPVYDGVLGNMSSGIIGAGDVVKVRQTFSRLVPPRAEREAFDSDPARDPDLRFTYFTTVILPSILRGADQEGILIYIPSYMDFTRVRNYLDAKEGVSFMSINEYTSVPDMNRAREFFASGRTKILLYTERFHHFRRYEIKGVLNVIYYGLPENPLFYREVTRNLVRTVVTKHLDPEMVKVRVIYSQWDAFKLERIVGTKRVAVMLKGTNETFEFK